MYQYGHCLETLFAAKSSPVFAINVHTNWRIMTFAPEGSWAIQTRATFWAIFEKFPLVPPLNVFRKCGHLVTMQKLP